MKPTPAATDVVRAFFTAFGKGDARAVVETFHPEATIVAVRKGERPDGGPYGTYAGTRGAHDFVDVLGRHFDTRAFSVDVVVGEGDVAFASGSFVHHLRATGKPFASDWALKVVVRDGRIFTYQFYEDSAAYAEASR